MDRQIFSDGIGQITITGGTIRLDFVAYSATEKDAAGQPMAVFCQRVIMSVDGFLRSAEKIQEAVQAVSRLSQPSREVRPVESVITPQATTAAGPPSPQPKRPFP